VRAARTKKVVGGFMVTNAIGWSQMLLVTNGRRLMLLDGSALANSSTDGSAPHMCDALMGAQRRAAAAPSCAAAPLLAADTEVKGEELAESLLEGYRGWLSNRLG
jgi:hypothetical protein